MWDDWIMLIALAIVLLLASGMLTFYKRGLGFIAGIILSVAMAVFGAAFEMIEILGAAPFIFFATLLIAAFGPRRDGSKWARIWARRVLSVCVLIVLSHFLYHQMIACFQD